MMGSNDPSKCGHNSRILKIYRLLILTITYFLVYFSKNKVFSSKGVGEKKDTFKIFFFNDLSPNLIISDE